jgi:hypothetical protein
VNTPGADGITSMAVVDGVLEQANGFHERDIGVQLPRGDGDRHRWMLTRKVQYQDSRLVKPK